MLTPKKRKFSRISFDRQVNLDFFTDWYNDCQISDLCLTGMFIKGDFPHRIGEYCLLTLMQTGECDLMVQATGKIVRKNDRGIALEFTAMTFESYMYLQMSLLYEADDPLDIGLELPENCPFALTEETVIIPEVYRFLHN